MQDLRMLPRTAKKKSAEGGSEGKGISENTGKLLKSSTWGERISQEALEQARASVKEKMSPGGGTTTCRTEKEKIREKRGKRREDSDQSDHAHENQLTRKEREEIGKPVQLVP